MDTTIDKVSIEIDSNSKSATTGIYSLVTQLNNLKTATSGSYKNLSRLSTYLKELKSSSQGLEKVSNNLSGLSNISKSLGKLSNIPKATGLSSVIKTLKTLPDISSQLSNTEIEKFVNKINELTNAIKPLATQVTKLTSGLQKLPTSLNKINKEIDKTKNKSKGSGKGIYSFLSTGLTGTITKLSLVLMTMKRIGSTLKGFVDESANYTESLNLFTVSMGSYAEQATEFVNTFSNALYLDPSSLMQYMGAFQNLITGLGVGEDKAYTMSKTLTQLAYDLSSFKNISIESAFEKLQSGISGEIEPLRNMGVALSVATLQELAFSLGIKESVSSMTEAQKAQLRYIQILKSSTNWQGDMARTLISPANAMRVIQQQFTLLARAIGNVFIPILLASIPYVMVFTQALTSLANKLASFLGFEIADIDYSSLTDASTYATDLSDSADSATDSLNGMLASFDDLNVVQKESTGDSLLDSNDLGIDLDSYDALNGLTDKFKAGMDDAKQKLQDLLPVIVPVASALAGLWAINKISTFKDALAGVMGKASTGTGTAITAGAGLIGMATLLAIIVGTTYVITLGIYGAQQVQEAIEKTSVSTASLAKNTSDVSTNYAELMRQGKLTEEQTKSYTDYLVNNTLKQMDNIEALKQQKSWLGEITGSNKEVQANIALSSQAIEFNTTVLDELYKQGYLTKEMYAELTEKIFGNINTGKLSNTVFKDTEDKLKNLASGMKTVDVNGDGVITKFDLIASNAKNIGNNADTSKTKVDLLQESLNKFSDKKITLTLDANVDKLTSAVSYGISKGVGNVSTGTNNNLYDMLGIKKYEDGGFPDSASLFFANENGVPEMVGQMGNRTAVANNDQITTGIENAVYRAMISANSSKSDQPAQVTVNVGNKTLYKEGAKYSSKQVDRYGNTVIKV